MGPSGTLLGPFLGFWHPFGAILEGPGTGQNVDFLEIVQNALKWAQGHYGALGGPGDPLEPSQIIKIRKCSISPNPSPYSPYSPLLDPISP